MIDDALAAPMASWYLVLVSSTLLVFLGALMVLSSSSVYSSAVNQGNPWYIAQRQLFFLVVGLPFAAWLAFQKPPMLKLLSWVAFIGSLLLLLAIFVPGLGSDAGKGNLAWLVIGPLSLQPSEFAKLGLVMWAAAVASTKERVLDQPRELAPLVAGFAVVEVLVLAQKDLGTALVIGAIAFSILFVLGVPIRMLGVAVAVAGAAVLALVVTSPNRMRRVAAFVSGTVVDDPNASQQPLSAIYALASGGWWGLGLGYSRQKWGNLNDGAQNDFVFAVLGEEMGLMGTLSVLLLFGVLGYAGLRIAMRADSLFVRVLAAGTTSWLLFQALVNIGVAMKMLPVVGVPLPFISAGGSALMANLLAVGVLLACARQEPAARRRLARKAGEPRPKVTTVVDGGR
ncbi:FtsW/RodA/SpoVE family cell cycle protein [Luteococcus sp. OSA5]|uniref:FtsW/RodA/SpoVE family cell cycle protein n=1 Tax=Luteococcus sp. OSA5 TaxID=3401630 RepID=UPI003B42A949